MATPADQRLLELLEKWLKSLELHAKYSSLDDDSYWKIRSWVAHQRPSRWIIDVALQKALELRTHVLERVKSGDTKYAESLELMTFLANLVGSEHIERFIPLADAEEERSLSQAPPEDAAAAPSNAATGTREMPTFLAAKRAAPPAGTATVARTERKSAAPAEPAAKPVSKSSPVVPSDRGGPSQHAREQVIADAARLLQWGRNWYELAELIARMAGRPSLTEVRRILKENKSDIDALTRGALP